MSISSYCYYYCFEDLLTNPLLRVHVCFLWDRALIEDVVYSTFDSLARCYTHPFLLVMSIYFWKERSVILRQMFKKVQIIGCSKLYKFRGSKGSGDSLIMAIVSSPEPIEVAALPPLDASSPSVFDLLQHRFDSFTKREAEYMHLLSVCDLPTQREHHKPMITTFDEVGKITER